MMGDRKSEKELQVVKQKTDGFSRPFFVVRVLF